MKNVKEFPILETRRLAFRSLKMSDAPEILRLRSEPEMLKYIEMHRLYTLDEASEMILANQRKFSEETGIM